MPHFFHPLPPQLVRLLEDQFHEYYFFRHSWDRRYARIHDGYSGFSNAGRRFLAQPLTRPDAPARYRTRPEADPRNLLLTPTLS